MKLHSEPLGSSEPEAARLLHNLAALYDVRRRYQQAEPLYRQAMAELEKRFGPEDWEVALVMNNLALLCQKTGRPAEAISYLERSLSLGKDIRS
jgi:tetratricopeptide (TPR) repeat protein